MLRSYWYWRGVAFELKTRVALADFLQRAPLIPKADELPIDLSQGLESAEAILDALRPRAVFIRYEDFPIGSIPPAPGFERLRSDHLRPLLTTEFSKPMLFALALNRAICNSDSDSFRKEVTNAH